MNTKQKLVGMVLALLTSSASFLLFVEKNEGLGPFQVVNNVRIYQAYPDPGLGWKLPTICAGHTKGVKRGDTATLEQCRKWLDEDTQWAKNRVAKCLSVPVTVSQFEALTSFEYNTGLFCSSQLRTYVNENKCYLAANEFNNSPQIDKKTGQVKLQNGKVVMKFTTAGGIVLNGLVRRRTEERRMFEKDC